MCYGNIIEQQEENPSYTLQHTGKIVQITIQDLLSSYAAAASPGNKDVVIVLDTSAAIKQPSGVLDKTKIVVAKEAANNVIQILTPNDRVGLVTFDFNASTPSGETYHPCYQRKLSFATKVNTDKLKDYIFKKLGSSNADSDVGKALHASFDFFTEITTELKDRDQVILFISDGKSTIGTNPGQVIADRNKNLQNRVMIFTYLISSDDEAKMQMREMAEQAFSNTTYGSIRGGKYQYFDQTNITFLSTTMATFYDDLPEDSQNYKSTFTPPYVDPFSGIGLITSLCLPFKDTQGLKGIACTDAKLSELLAEVEFFSSEEYSYAFIIDGTGRALTHPLLPDATYVKSDQNQVLVDISVLEREADKEGVIASMKKGYAGYKSFDKYFTKARGILVNDGSMHKLLHANYFWGPVPQTSFSLCVVLSFFEIAESTFSQNLSTLDMDNAFTYHNRSLLNEKFQDCKFYKRRVTLERSCVNFSPSAFSNPFQYLDREETTGDVYKYKIYLDKASEVNPGFKATILSSVWSTYKAEQYWKNNDAKYVSLRYIATKSGLIRLYPCVLMHKSYNHQTRPWWWKTLSHPDIMVVTTPYLDASGAGIVITFTHTIFKRSSNQVTAVVAADFPLEYFNWFINNVYPSCENLKYRCMIIDDSGYFVMHPRFKEITEESQFQESKHEPGIAIKLKINGVLNAHECQDFSKNKNLVSYRITLPQIKLGGLDFKDTDDHFEMRPISETNLFIIREAVKSPSVCKCDGSELPDDVSCSSICECLCFNSISYDVCANRYDVIDSSLPCSARVPDPSALSEDNINGLSTCYTPNCPQYQTDQMCIRQAECSWCKYTDQSVLISTPCCRNKEDCTFGRTKSTNRNVCEISTTTTNQGDKEALRESPGTIAAIVG